MNSPPHRRLAVLGIAFGIGGPAVVRVAKANGYVASYQGLLWGTVAMGVFCILGAFISYRVVRRQVEQDRKDLGLDG